MKKIILSILATIMFIPALSMPIEVVAEEVTTNKTLRVATHNLAAPNEDKAKEISQRYIDHKIDIVGVQEADMFNGRNNYDTIKTLENDRLPYSHFAKGRDYNNGDFGIGYISKYKIIEQSSEPIEHPSGSAATKVIERVVIDVDGELVALYNVHFSWEGLELRQRQMKQLKDRVNQDPVQNIIMVGDFNVDQHLFEYSIFKDQFNLANGGSYGSFDTYLDNDDTNMKHNKIDNILVSKNMSITNVDIDPDRTLSDHALFFADISLDGGNRPTQGTDILPGKALSYSHAQGNGIEQYDIYKITDKDALSFESLISEQQTITVDLHGMYSVDDLTVNWSTVPNSFSILTGKTESDMKEIYSSTSVDANSIIPINDSVKNIKIQIDGVFGINSISASGNEVFNVSGNNHLINGDFNSIVPEPQTQPPGFENAHWDTDMWAKDVKPENWIYQKYPVSTATTDFIADVYSSDRPESSGKMVEISKINNSGSGFFKQMKTPLDANTSYTIGFWYKYNDINSQNLKLSVTEYNSSGTKTSEFVKTDLVSESSNDWKYYEYTWTTHSNTSLIDIVFRLDNTTGTYFLEDLSLTSRISIPQSFEIARHTITDNKLETGESVQLTSTYFPLTPDEAGISVSWVSEDENIAVVNADGVVTGIGEGEVFIKQINNVTDRYHSSIKVFVTGETEVIVPDPVNLIPNGDFGDQEIVPTDPYHFSSNTFHDAGLWRDTEVKPSVWMFQKWKPDANSDDFKAYYITEEDNSYVKVDVSSKANATMNFLKNIRIPVQKNKQYILSADIQQLISKGDLLIRVERNNNARINYNFNGVDEKFENYEVIFNSDNSDSINLIIGYEQNASGSYLIDNVELFEYDGKPRNILMDEELLIVRKGDTVTTLATVGPIEAVNKNVIYSSENENIATVDSNGTITAVSAGKTNIVATAAGNENLSIKREVLVTDGDIEIEGITIKDLEDTLITGERRFLHVDTTPIYANETPVITWSSSNEEVASFEGNKLVTHKAGTTTIKAVHKGGQISAEKEITVSKKELDDFRIMRNRWRDNLIGNESTMDLTDKDIKRFVDNLDAKSNELFNTMHKESEREEMTNPELWDVVDTTAPAHMTTQFRNLYTLSQAFMIEGTSLYQNEDVFNEVLSGFDFMMTVKKYTGGSYTGNWWDWQIGSAQPFAHSLLILDDYLTQEQKVKYVEPIKGYNKSVAIQIPSVTSSGANRTDIAISVLATAILLEDEDRMAQIPKYVPSVMFNKNTGGDGYYEDGSFVQHGDKAYSGSYGVETIRGLSTIISIIDGTKWGFDESTENYTNLYTIIPDTYFPIIHKGMNMAMNQGRSISRAPGTNKFAPAFSGGAELSANLLTLANYMPEDLEQEIKEHVKFWYQDSKEYYDYMENARDLEMLLNLKAVVNDDTIEAKVSTGLKVMTAMARVINIRENFSAGVSMTSYKISNYESGNTENPYGFHTGDGMLYLYNDDLEMYGDKYWPTVDWYRLPGITVDTRVLSKDALANKTSAGMRWVGGVSNGLNGSSGMTLDKSKQNKNGTTFDLKAKKSYFFIDDKIVAMGSDISGTTDATIETIVENRLLSKDAQNIVKFNGEEILNNTNKQVKVNDWAHLQGKTDNSSIGYYFLEEVENLELSRVERSGTYNDINNFFGSDKVYEEEYFLMSAHHGKAVNDDKYAYVILPGLTSEETERVVTEGSISIVQNSKDVHAIIDEKSQTFAANVYTKDVTTFDLSEYDFPVKSLTVNNAVAIIIEVNQYGKLSVEVSSPMREGDESLISMTLANGKIIENGEKIKDITETADTVEFTFISNGLAGRSDGVVVEYKVEEDIQSLVDELKSLYAKADNEVETNYTVASWEGLPEVIEEARLMIEKLNLRSFVNKEDIKEMIDKLTEALENLVESGDLNNAKLYLNSIDENAYTEYALESLVPLMDELNTLINNRESQDILSAKITEINELLLISDKKIDLSKYETILDTYKDINLDEYTEESKDVFTKAYSSLELLVSNYDESQKLTVTKEELEDDFKNLLSAINNLEKIENIKEEVDEKLEALIRDAKELINEILRRENISEELKLELDKLVTLVNDKNTTYDALLNQYNIVKELAKKSSITVPTGLHTNSYLWITLLTIAIVAFLKNKRKYLVR